ncbi:MAG TPA: glycosyltransferase [Dermatophilaceae bacterium]|jgi:MGT family glycosyltransferase
MARILAYTSPAAGHLFPLTPILDELAARGHQIAVRTLAAQVPLMQAHGFAAGPISERVEAITLDDWRARNTRQGLSRAVKCFCARAEYDAPDLRQAITDERPDALIVDINSWGALAAAEAWGGPWAAVCPYPLAMRSPDVPPFGPGLPPPAGPFGRLRDKLLRPVVFGAIEHAMRPSLNDVRRLFQLDPVEHVDDMFRRPPLVLYLTAEPFEYPRRDWPDNIVMVGPCDWDPPTGPPGWLSEITGPIVLVTTSSAFQNDGRLVQAALDGLAAEPVSVVATFPAADPARFNPPANARVVRFIPHGQVLDRAVCAVTHGGMGATQKALAHGVPVCVVPFGRDQLEVARRVEVAEAGTRLSARRLRPNRLRDKVQEAIARTAGAERIAAAFAAAGGASGAADAVETRLLRRAPDTDHDTRRTS